MSAGAEGQASHGLYGLILSGHHQRAEAEHRHLPVSADTCGLTLPEPPVVSALYSGLGLSSQIFSKIPLVVPFFASILLLLLVEMD